jgi:predicted nucleic-acid-binding protein
MRSILLTSDTILRFLLDDQPDVTQTLTKLFESAEEGNIRLVVDSIVIGECCAVLQSKEHQFQRELIVHYLTLVLLHPGVECDRLSIVLDALESYAHNESDFTNTYLDALAKASGYDVVR